MRQTFRKDERLRKKILITKLFREGSSFFVHPFRVTWLATPVPCDFPAQVLVAVPKQFLRKAVKRNIIKRRMREGYRKNKYILYDFLTQKQGTLVFAITYTSKEILAYNLLQEKIIVLLHRLLTEYEKGTW
jgi:ribonuclease P protein component